jgi:hypothetical protein
MHTDAELNFPLPNTINLKIYSIYTVLLFCLSFDFLVRNSRQVTAPEKNAIYLDVVLFSFDRFDSHSNAVGVLPNT